MNKQDKIRPKKSWEITENCIGGTSTRLPRSEQGDFQPFLPINLIDGDTDTYWCSGNQFRSKAEFPVWLRLDLPTETIIKSVLLVPRKDKRGFPRDIVIKISRNGLEWATVCEKHNYKIQKGTDINVFDFPAQKAKQVLVIGNDLEKTEVGYCFSIAEIQVIDTSGVNVAMASRGTVPSVSSTCYGYVFERTVHDQLWPIHYDLGLKWLRVAYWDSTLNWHHVEKDRGKYVIDSRTDEVITETEKNGINIVLCLAYGNWLYTTQGRRSREKQIWEHPYDAVPGEKFITTPEMREGYCNFVRFMVQHFKDRIRYYEIWNEQDVMGISVTDYCDLVKQVAPIVRKEYPEAKIVLGSVGGHWENHPLLGSRLEVHYDYLKECIRLGVAPLVDVIAWHPFYGHRPDDPYYQNYPKIVKEIKELAESEGFGGEYMATEFAFWSELAGPGAESSYRVTEIVKAKYLARCIIMHIGLEVIPFWNETYEFLFRPTYAGGIHPPYQPEPAYYILRTLCTVMDNARPVSCDVELSNKKKKIDTYIFTLPGDELLVAVWLPEHGVDNHPGVESDIIIKNVQVRKVIGVDTLNGFEQELLFTHSKNNLTIPNVLVKDYPILLRIEK